MRPFSLYLDENRCAPSLMRELAANGFDALRCADAGMLGQRDEEHLALAARLSRTVLTEDGKDFAPLHWRWMRDGRRHSGVILTRPTLTIGQEIRRICFIADVLRADETLDGQLLYLSDWD